MFVLRSDGQVRGELQEAMPGQSTSTLVALRPFNMGGIALFEIQPLASLRRVVEMNDKRRFTLSPDGLRIRAALGHSLPVDLDLPAVQPPDRLWHGTARDNLPSIFREGLKPGRRQMVHLSTDRDTAQRVGERHGKAVILAVEAGLMFRNRIPLLSGRQRRVARS